MARPAAMVAALGVMASALTPGAASAQSCARTLTADVVALDQSIWYNRFGAVDPDGMIFALRRDVVARDGSGPLSPGNVKLRSDKRPRPLTLRMNVGDCLQVKFQNLLTATPTVHEEEVPPGTDPHHPEGSPARNTFGSQPSTRAASVHVMGLSLVGSIASDGSNVGTNPSSLAAPGGTATYTYYAEREGGYFMYSTGATVSAEGDGGTISRGLFGAVNVQPKGSQWFRSQVTASDLQLAAAKDGDGLPMTTPAGQPILDYAAVYPSDHPQSGIPILAMLRGNEIVHGDLNAIVTGPSMGAWPAGTYPKVAVAPTRDKPFREFTVIFHDETGIVQAFDEFSDPYLEHTLHSGRDAFAINYGSGGVGAEVLANRKGVGPVAKCNDCKFEEFFLASWALGDPAMVVDVPANAKDENGEVIPGYKATKAYYPDDPSNVHHSYIGDNVKFRNIHAGPKEHHIFHLHAHQWLKTPDSDNSTYLDSQGLGPGSSYTYEITYGGSGNRNKVVGDAIFHCHFYPHFAQGMWELWRSHDVLETGTELDAEGRPVAGARALPDAEIEAGTPIPAVVPIPGQALPVMPGTDGNPGYPFFIAGKAGHRAPRPPLDVARGEDGSLLDGGLRRHVVTGGESEIPELNPLDFHKEAVTLEAEELPEEGTPEEQKAIAFHNTREHATFKVDPLSRTVSEASFITNGSGRPMQGAPFADPCVDDSGRPISGTPRLYKAAGFQMDVKYNKAGWHYPQHRMYSLFEDVVPTMNGDRAPEPLFFRTNSGECIQFNLVNLIPKEYQMDDYQVTTPTDIIGQHIHLVKFDVTSSDGSGNGWNYEDGSLSPGDVVERIRAIRRANMCIGLDSGDERDDTFTCPVAKAHPFFGAGENGEWLGAQETIQRWYADQTLNNAGQDRTLRTVFTHDHFGPSTHQQTGLYAGLVTEPKGSTWRDPETGNTYGTRADGGPTSWKADILTTDPALSFREFLVEYQDFAPAYRPGKEGLGPDPERVINPPAKKEIGLPLLVEAAKICPNFDAPPCPELVSASDIGTMTVNYRNEPVALRIRDPQTNKQAAGDAGDLSWVFSSSAKITRADAAFNTQPTWYPKLSSGVQPTDPYTPLMRAYEGDRVQMRMLIGGDEEGHNFSFHGMKWLAEPNDPNSGYRNSQFTGISEHFEEELLMPPLPGNSTAKHADYLWKAGSSSDDLWNGLWGIMRSYRTTQPDLLKLPSNPTANAPYTNASSFNGVCPVTAPQRNFDVTVGAVKDLVLGGKLIYEARTNNGGPLNDPSGIIFVRTSDIDPNTGKIKPGIPNEPVILRAAAGDCINMTLRSKLPATPVDLEGYSTLPLLVEYFNMNEITASNQMGLHPQLVAFDVTRSDGANVGFNSEQAGAGVDGSQVARPGQVKTYKWYAGDLKVTNGQLLATPMEFGATNLIASDPIKHSAKGAIGALIIEPKGAYIREALLGSRASANIILPNGTQFQDNVLIFQDDINLRYGDGTPVGPLAETHDAEDSGHKAFNYTSEPLWKRMGIKAETPLHETRLLDYSKVLSNVTAPDGGDPLTPVFKASLGQQVRFRILQPGGHQRNHVFQIHGHSWQENPYFRDATGAQVIGNNPLSQWVGSQMGIGPSSHFDIVLQNGAGGKFRVPGDYLYRDQQSFMFDGGLWGIFRVR
ncbi:MAG TPA: hypothetical protein VNA89_05810 [Gemmatimonadaceae bacterium]|nr:hypothetical protein [Gemmatimonadaceae bacterium]